MTQLDTSSSHAEFEAATKAHDPLRLLARAFDRLAAHHAARRERRRTMELLRTLDDDQLRDIGLDPAAIFGERVGTIGEIHGDRFHGL